MMSLVYSKNNDLNSNVKGTQPSISSVNALNTKSNVPMPYGIIPKRNKKTTGQKIYAHSNNNLPITKRSSRNKSISPSAPYPCFSSLAPTSSPFFLSVFNNLFNSTKKEEKPVGFMPRKSLTEMSQLVDIAVSSSPIDCRYYSKEDQDNCSAMSSGSSSSESSLSSLFSSYVMEEESTPVSDNCTSEMLSDILCGHYVQSQMNTPSPSSSDDVVKDVPLETFRMFKAPNVMSTYSYYGTNKTSNDTNSITTSNLYKYWMTMDDQQEAKEWTLVEEKQLKAKDKPSIENQIEQLPVEEKCSHEQDQDLAASQRHTRDIRANGAYLRMIVAEVNMMRSQKIIGPLRPRRVLPKRLDTFMHRPTKLQLVTA